MRHIPPLSAVRVFESAARHENFTQAAAELGMTQAAVSYQIRLLEERLGVPLFARSKQRVTLTEAGRKAAPTVSGALDALSDAFSGLIAEDGAVLSISTAQSFASTWLSSRLGSFQIAQPDLAVRLSTDNRLVDFASEDVDVAVRIGNGPWPGLRQHFLFRSNVSPICSAEFAERYRLERPEQLLQVPRLSPDDRWWKLWLSEAGLTDSEATGPRGVGLDNQVMEANAALAGHGIAMMTPFFWREELRSGRLVQPFAHIALTGTSYWLVYPEHKRNQRKVSAFREWLRAEIAVTAAQEPAEVFAEPVDISASALA
jgi:LysR family glycine cleavage system transcriptional activator